MAAQIAMQSRLRPVLDRNCCIAIRIARDGPFKAEIQQGRMFYDEFPSLCGVLRVGARSHISRSEQNRLFMFGANYIPRSSDAPFAAAPTISFQATGSSTSATQ